MGQSSSKKDPILLEEGLTAEEIQAERKEYVNNIKIEYQYSCYEEKNADGCHLLGEYMEAIEKNANKAFELFQRNCEQNKHSTSCYRYAIYLVDGKVCERSMTKALKPAKISCDQKKPEACKLLSLIHWNGEDDRAADPKLAEKYMKIACDMDNGDACGYLHSWYLGLEHLLKYNPNRNSSMGHLDRDVEKAVHYGEKACNLGNVIACKSMSRLYYVGDGVAKDEDKADQYFKKFKEFSLVR
ncbi:cytochrome c oxidase assembly factor 7 like protein [Ditylenchus destructor]|nr:cytochrome c oxidase assembly factor 7 like protein [Ditylenchus destructor]